MGYSVFGVRTTVLAGIASLMAVLAVPASEAADASLPVSQLLAYSDGGVIYLADVPDGETTTFPIGPAGAPSWSPFGRWLAFYSSRDGDSALYAARPDGTGLIRVAASENLDWSWAPDGNSIAWVSHTSWKDLWVTDLTTGVATNLTNGTMEVWSPGWSPDGRFIAFESIVGDGYFDIFAVEPRGGSPVNLTNNQTSNDLSPAWSPDGTRIAFVSQRGGEAGPYGLYSMATDGSGLRRLYEVDDEECSRRLRALAWSPDGSFLAFAEDGCGSPVLHDVEFVTVPALGGARTSLASGGGYRSGGPVWSPDGTRLAVVTGGFSFQGVTVVDAGGHNPVTLADLVGENTRSPAWSPDGSTLAFVADPYIGLASPPPDAEWDIWTVLAGGTDPQHLVSGDSPAWRPEPARPVGLVDPATGLWHLHGERAFYFGTPGDVPMLGDWDCDGVDTAGLYRPTDGYVYLTNVNATSVATTRFHLGIAGDVPLAGDWDGDGCDTVSVYRPSEGRVFIADRLGADEGWFVADYDYYFGESGDKPFAGDFDGDGVDTVGLHRESSGYVYFLNRHQTAVADVEFFYGLPGDRLVAGDWTGDGIDTVAIYRPVDARFYFRYTNTQGVADATLFFGSQAWLPVAGTFAGDRSG